MSIEVFELLFQGQTRSLMPLERHDGRNYIRSPMWYADGDAPLIEVGEDTDGYFLSDRGDSLGRFGTGWPQGSMPPEQHPAFQSALLVHEVGLRDDGSLVRRCGKSRNSVGEAYFDFLHCLLKIDLIERPYVRSSS